VDFDELEERDDSGEDLWYHGRSRTPFTGWIKGFHDNGELFSLEPCKNGKVHGFFVTWYESGKKRSEGHFKHGQADGIWIMYTENGTEEFRQTYKDGELISEE
jgi:antitoxin component YwqK of YwqJK toxin-antitoxin module